MTIRKLVSGVAAGAAMVAAGAVNAAGLAKARSVTEGFSSEWLSYVPALAALVLMVVAVLWWFRVIRPSTFGTLAIGLLIIGSARDLVGLFI